MATYTPQYYGPSTGAVPIPSKGSPSCSGYQSGGSTYSVSPPEDSSNNASVTSGVPSYGGGHHHHGSSTGGGYTTTTTTTTTDSDYYYDSHHQRDGSHGGNNGAYYHQDGAMSAASASGVDFNEYIQDRFADSFDPIPLDRSLAVQAQTSGQLNAKHRELLELQAKAQARLAKSRARFQEGLQDAQEVRANLEWTSKKVSSLKKKAEKKHSKEYKKARERYPSPEY